MSQVSLNEWIEFIELHPESHLLQTTEWGELKAAFGWDVVRIVCENIGVQILFRRFALGLTVAYVPKPLIGMLVRASGNALWQELESICRQRHAIFLKIEPDGWISEQTGEDSPVGLEHSLGRETIRPGYNIQPPRTLLVDLTGSEDEILGRMKQKCRYNIRLAEKKGVIVRAWGDVKGFHTMMTATGRRDGFAVHSLEYYREAYQLFHPAGKCELLIAEYENIPLAALMVFKQGRRAWYVYGASNDVERNRMPTYLLQWEAMRWAKTRNCIDYDLWGVPDASEQVLEENFETRHDGLWGVYRFKRGFGGRLVRAAQAVDVIFKPALYRLYRWRTAGREAP